MCVHVRVHACVVPLQPPSVPLQPSMVPIHRGAVGLQHFNSTYRDECQGDCGGENPSTSTGKGETSFEALRLRTGRMPRSSSSVDSFLLTTPKFLLTTQTSAYTQKYQVLLSLIGQPRPNAAPQITLINKQGTHMTLRWTPGVHGAEPAFMVPKPPTQV